MKTTNRLVAVLLAAVMIISCLPLSIFAADTASGLSYTSELYESEALDAYKQYEAMWKDATYVKADVKYTVYFDPENATDVRDVVFYVINWNGERIGTDSDIDIVTDLIEAPASIESGNRWAVVVVDFGGNELAMSPNIELSLAYLRQALPGSLKLTVWSDETRTATTTVPVHEDHVYVLPAGYRVARDIPYFETDYHASLGTREYVLSGWNSHIAWNDELIDSVYKANVRLPKAVEYAWHTGDEATCSYDHATYTDVECYPGAPQEIDGEVVYYKKMITHTGNKSTCEYPHDILVKAGCTKNSTSNVNWAPVATRYQDLRKTDGSPLDYVCRLDIIYPSGEDVEATPVMVQAATQSPRMTNIGTVSSKDYDGDGVTSLKNRTMLIGMAFCGYTVSVYDYAYSPMSRGDHYGYIDPYGAHGSNAAKTSRAAIRCIRYFAEMYGYNDSLIGVAGISKGTPTAGVLSTINNKYVEEGSSFTYDVYGTGTKVNTGGVWYEGDIGEDGHVAEDVTTTKVVQPYLTYEAGYNGKKVNGEDVNYDVTRTGEISSDVSVVYCAAGDGINRVYKGGESIILGGTNPTTGEETQHVPMVLSCGYYDEYGCWNHWQGIQDRFTEYADNPFIAIGMEDMGHDYPSGIDPMRDYDRYNAYMQFLHSVLNPKYYTPQVAWIMPVDGAEDVSVVSTVQVQLIKPAESLEKFKSAASVKDNYGKSVDGTWTTNAANTSGLYTFTPAEGYIGGTEYTVTVGEPVVAETTSKSFTVEAAGFVRPVADTYISAANKTGVFGAETTLYIDNQRTYLATFKTSDFDGANKAYLNIPLSGAGTQNISVYVLDGFSVNESTTNFTNTPARTEDNLIGVYAVSQGDNELDLLGIAAKAKSEYFTIAVSGSAHYFEENFETYTVGNSLRVFNSNNSYSDADANALKTGGNSGVCSTENFVWRTGGGTPSIYSAKDPANADNKVAKVTSNYSYNRIKWYNSFVRDGKYYFDQSDLNKKFNISFDVRVDVPSGVVAKKIQAHYEMSKGASNEKYGAVDKTLSEATWTNITGSYTVSQAMIDNKSGLLCFMLNSTATTIDGTAPTSDKSKFTYYFDDIIVSEVAPTALVSRESTESVTAYITTEVIDESGIVADTYVSKAMPNGVFGNSERLLLNGGDDENIMFVTYSSKLVDGKKDLTIIIPAEDKASVKAEILLLDDYYVNESSLSYNTMPDLSKAISLGDHTITGGVNAIEIAGAVEDIKGDYFTIVLKAKDSVEFVLFNNFEDYNVGADVNTSSNNVTDPDNSSYTYYYGHRSEVKTGIARSGGAANGIGNVIVDPTNDDNNAINVLMSKSYAYNGRIKFFNSISDDVLTADSDLVGETLRFTVRVKAANEYTVANSANAFASVMLSAGGDPVKDAQKVSVASPTYTLDDEWSTITVDYKVNAADIKVDTKANGNPAWGYPMFTIDFKSVIGDEQMIYLVDDITVVKLNSDGTVSRLDIASSEGEKSKLDTIGIRARSEKDPVADTYISAENKAGVFGFEDNVYVDAKRTYLVSFKAADLYSESNVSLKLPFTGNESQTISVYLLDGFKVDETKTCYNNTPERTSDNLIGTYEVSDGGVVISLDEIIAAAQGEYFTIAISGSAKYFELNFDEYTSDTTVGEYDNNVADESAGRTHMYGFAEISKVTPLTTRRGGNLGTRKIISVNGERLFSVTTSDTVNYGGYLKFYNSISTSADDDVVGKKFNYSVDVKLIGNNSVAESAAVKPKVDVGIMRTGANDFVSKKTVTYNDLKADGNGWITISGNYTVPESEIGKTMTSTFNPKDRFSYLMFGMFFEHVGVEKSGSYTYYVDNIAVSEEAPNTIASLDSFTGEKISISTGNDVVADTYVSRANPDTVYGNEDVLKLGDEGGDKKAVVLSFSNTVLDESNYVVLNLNNSGAALKDVSVYYVLDYLVNESTLTWNTMPDYEDNLLGVYDIGEGDTKIDLFDLRDKIKGEYFTLVLRTESHSYNENFEGYANGYQYYDSTSKDNNQKDPDVETNVFYHGFHDLSGMSRRGGNLDSRYVIADVTNAGNQVLKVPSNKGTGDGCLKFYNALNYAPITKESDIIGKTFRFSFRAKADVANSNASALNTLEITSCVITSWTNTYIKKVVVGSADLQNGWKTYTIDYTVNAADVGKLIRGQSWATGSPVWQTYTSFPMFGIYFGDDDTSSASHVYLIDDLTVVELVDGAPIGDAVISSREATSGIRFTSAIDGNVTVIETTASSADNGDIISIFDGAERHSILRAEGGKLVFGETVLCDEQGNDIVLTDTPVKVVAIYDDVKGTVRFAVGDYLAYYKDGDSVRVTYEHLIIEDGVSDGATFGVKGVKASKLKNTTSEVLGFQTHYVNRAVRFISGVDAIYYNAIGFKLETASAEKTLGSTTVYSSIVDEDKTVYATEYGYNLMSAISITDIENGGVVKVTPFLRVGDNYIYGTEKYYKITVGDKVTVVETDESEFGVETNADLASIEIDGEPLAGFSVNVLNYNVPAADPMAMNVTATAKRSEASVSVTQNGNMATITVTALDGVTRKVYTLTAYEKVESAVVNKNGADAIVTYVFDDGNTDSASLVVGLAEKYPAITGSFALITKNLATLSTIEGEEGDGLLEYEFDENGDYVYTKIDSKWNYWVDLFDKYGDRFEGVSHTHTHEYIGENDNGGTFEYKSTAGATFTSAHFPIGNVRKEYYASNQILRELGQRALTMVGAGLTAPDGNMINYTESYKALPQTSGAFIGKRTTYTYPKTPEVMVNNISDFTSEDNRFNVKSYMVQHYNTSSTAPSGTSASNYSKAACLEAGVGYWTDYIDTAVDMGGWAAFCFHNVKADTYTGTSGHFVYESQADAVFAHTQALADENKVWVANFTDACLYVFERATSVVGSYINEQGNVVVVLDDKEDDALFTMPLTVKVALPAGKSGATLNGEALKAFTEDGATYVYVDIVPGNSVTLEVK